MELRLFRKNGEEFTRFKIPKAELNTVPAIAIKMYAAKPSKESSKFTYYELKGDYLNGKFN